VGGGSDFCLQGGCFSEIAFQARPQDARTSHVWECAESFAR
jgi:hypothetical protein